MAVKIRLSPKGKKGQKYYHIVIADSRSPVKGKFIEKIGTYSPMENPTVISLKEERAFHWLKTGAIPSDTVRSILQRYGLLYRFHLYRGVLKGAITEEQAFVKLKKFKETQSKKFGKVVTEKLDSLTLEEIVSIGPNLILKTIKHSESMIDISFHNEANKKVKEKCKESIYQDRIILDKNEKLNMENMESNQFMLDIDISIDNEKGKVLKINNEYNLNVMVMLNDPEDRKELIENLGIIVKPKYSAISGDLYKKLSLDSSNKGSTVVTFIPQKLGTSELIVELLQKTGVLKSIPLEFKIVD